MVGLCLYFFHVALENNGVHWQLRHERRHKILECLCKRVFLFLISTRNSCPNLNFDLLLFLKSVHDSYSSDILDAGKGVTAKWEQKELPEILQFLIFGDMDLELKMTTFWVLGVFPLRAYTLFEEEHSDYCLLFVVI